MKPSFYARSVREGRAAPRDRPLPALLRLARSTVLRLYASLTGGVGRFAVG